MVFITRGPFKDKILGYQKKTNVFIEILAVVCQTRNHDGNVSTITFWVLHVPLWSSFSKSARPLTWALSKDCPLILGSMASTYKNIAWNSLWLSDVTCHVAGMGSETWHPQTCGLSIASRPVDFVSILRSFLFVWYVLWWLKMSFLYLQGISTKIGPCLFLRSAPTLASTH